MTGRLLKISNAKADTWLTCPRRYRHKYLDRPAPRETGGPWAHLALGNSVHRALSLWVDEPPERRTPDIAVAHLADCWDAAGYRDDAHAAAWFTLAADWIADYTADPDVQAARAVGNERTVSARWGDDLVVEGRVDLIEARDGGPPTVVDYKVGRDAPTEDDAAGSYALPIYVWATRRMLGRTHGWCTRAELRHLPTGAVVGVDYTPERIARQLDRLRDIARDIAAARDYPATPGPLCASCPFWDRCPDGQARTGRAEPWTYLDGRPARPVA